MSEQDRRASIRVLAGTNGAGKSSVAGAAVRAQGGQFFNPDEVTREILRRHPDRSEAQANGLAWALMLRALDDAVAGGFPITFETTLGGRTVAERLRQAALAGAEIRMWYVALESADLHLDRVRRRVAEGGHDIPEATLRARYDSSRANLVRLLPLLTEVQVFDNSRDAGPAGGAGADPLRLLHMHDRHIVEICAMETVPGWAKAVIARALEVARA